MFFNFQPQSVQMCLEYPEDTVYEIDIFCLSQWVATSSDYVQLGRQLEKLEILGLAG